MVITCTRSFKERAFSMTRFFFYTLAYNYYYYYYYYYQIHNLPQILQDFSCALNRSDALTIPTYDYLTSTTINTLP